MRRLVLLLLLSIAVAAGAGAWLLRSVSKPASVAAAGEASSSPAAAVSPPAPVAHPPFAADRPPQIPAAVPSPAATVTSGSPSAVIASAWLDDSRPVHAAFRDWTRRYLAASSALRAELVGEGVRSAEARRVALANLIVADPEAALASAVPAIVRAQLPAAIVARLEKRVSARGELALNAVTPAPGGPPPDEPYFRTALVDGTEYRAHVYGRRALEATYPDTALVGIAVDGLLAVADSPVRMLEPGESTPAGAAFVTNCAACAASAADAAPGIAYEYAGVFGIAADAAHLAADLAALEADNQPGASSVVGRPSRAWTHGPKKVLLIRAVFADTPGAADDAALGLTESAAVQRFNGDGGVGDFFANASFGKTSLVLAPLLNGDSPDVTPVLRLPGSASGYATTNNGASASLHLDARLAAQAAGVDLAAYDRVGVVFPSLAAVPGSKITYGGLAQVIGSNFWINGAYTFRVVAHELGHTYGLRHANLWKVADGDPASGSGNSVEYGDPFDLMGGGEFFSSTDDFNPFGKSLLQWIPDAAVIVAEASGTYRIHRIDHPAADLDLARALKIVRDPVRDYWIGYRRATASPSVGAGAYVLWGYNENRQTDLLDLTTPGTDAADAALPVGATFTDTAAGITLTPVAQGGSGADEWLEVQVAFQPRIRWLEASVVADEQRGLAVLTLRRTSNSVGAVSVDYATEPGTASAGADYIHSAGVVSWADGDASDKTVAIPLVADGLVEGAETLLVRLSSPTGGVRVGDAAATVTIADPGARDAAFTADFINSTAFCLLPDPRGGIVIGGAFTQVGGENRGGLARLSAAGRSDPEFATGTGATLGEGSGIVRQLARQPDGRILIAGDFDAYDGVARDGFARLMPDGTLDVGFAPPSANGEIQAFLPLPDGRLLVGGGFTNLGGKTRECLARLLPDGTLDTSFVGPNFTDASWSRVEALAVQADGKILVGGSFYFSGGATFRASLCRLLPGGALDTGFNGVAQGAHQAGNTGSVRSVKQIVVQSDGRILIAGDFTAYNNTPRNGLARVTANGALDGGFNPALDKAPSALLALPDGSILVGGAFATVGGASAPRLARLTAGGDLDAAFAAAGAPAADVFDLGLSTDGRLCFAGHPAAFQGNELVRPVWRVLPGLADTAGRVEFSTDTYAAREGGAVVLTVRRVGGKLGAIRVGYATARNHSPDTAAVGADHADITGFLAWNDGDAADKTLSVPVHSDDLADEGETFTVRLGEPLIGGLMLGERQEAVVTISPSGSSPQTITFEAPAARVYGAGPFDLTAGASSGLPVGFELVSGPATLDGATLTPTGAGRVVVRATQAGSETFAPATPVERGFEIAKAGLTIRPDDQRRIVGAANPPLTAAYAGLVASDTTAELDKLPLVRSSATKKSKPGDYAITLSGGLDANYQFSFVPGILRVIGFGGAYEALLEPPGGGEPLGKLELTVSATSPAFSGVLNLGQEVVPVSFKGLLALDPLIADDPHAEDRATGRWTGAAPAPRDYRVTVNVGASGCVVSVYRGEVLIAEGQGPRAHAPAPRSSVAWAGPHTAWLDQLSPLDETDSRPVPGGAGHAAFTVAPSGLCKLAPVLPDGAKFTTTLKPDAAGVYRFFARPYGKRTGAYIVGEIDVGGGGDRSFVWRKPAKPGTPLDATQRAGFALAGRIGSAPWTPPRAATSAAPALRLSDLLGLATANGRFGIEFPGPDLGQSGGTLPDALVLDATTGRVSLHAPDPASPNPRKFSLAFTAKTGAFRGSFSLVDTVLVPGKAEARVTRKVMFAGVARTASGPAEAGTQIGAGFFLLKPMSKGEESATGMVRLQAGTP